MDLSVKLYDDIIIKLEFYIVKFLFPKKILAKICNIVHY